MSEAPALSAIITCLNEEQSIETFHGRLRAALEGSGRSFEVVLVNDGSQDTTWTKLTEIHGSHDRVTVVDLFKNAGQGEAIAAGLNHAEGDDYLFLDSDLQLDPEDLGLLLAELDGGHDFVSGCRKNRRDSLTRRLPSWLANRLMQRVAKTRVLTDFGCTFKVIRGGLVRAHQFGPTRPFNPVYVARSAARVREVAVNHHPRPYNRSGWTFRKLWAYMLESLVGASPQLFQLLSGVAFVITGLVVLRVGVAFLVPYSVLSEPVTNGLLLNAVLMSTAFLLGVLCIVGEYAIRSFLREHAGPLYAVREVRRKRGGEATSITSDP